MCEGGRGVAAVFMGEGGGGGKLESVLFIETL